MVTQEDTIFIQGMNPSTTEDELCQHFGSIGIIKVPLPNLFLNLMKFHFIFYVLIDTISIN